MQNEECRMRNAEGGMGKEEWGMQNVECRRRNAELWGVVISDW